MGNASICRLFEKCVICKQEVGSDWARPNADGCSRHFFHRPCLEAYARVNRRCPFDDTNFDSIITESGMTFKLSDDAYSPEDKEIEYKVALLRSYKPSAFVCPLCEKEDARQERARATTCDLHIFHRKCLIKAAAINDMCPAPECKAALREIRCELGDILPVSFFRSSIKCSLCATDAPEVEYATPNRCNHRFHRNCLTRFAYQKIASNEDLCCPDCNQRFHFLRCAYGEHVWIENFHRKFTCKLCDCEDREQEAAVPLRCDHTFHRTCLMAFCRTADYCPEEGCNGILTYITCQSEEILRKEPDSMIAILAEASDDHYVCQECNKPEDGSGRAKLLCGCVFHRTCIALHAPCDHDLKCPSCKTDFDCIYCHIGPNLQPSPRTK